MAKQKWALAAAMTFGIALAAAQAKAQADSGSTMQPIPTATGKTDDTTKPLDDQNQLKPIDKATQSGTEAMKKAEFKLSDFKADQIEKIQQKLKDEGYYKGPIDGVAGSRTKTALREFAKTKGLEFRDRIDASLLNAFDINRHALRLP